MQNWIQSEIPRSELACTLCQASCALICQIYAPSDVASPYHRCLYVFACIQPACWNQPQSWKAFRGQLKTQDLEQKSTNDSNQDKVHTLDWGVDDDWGQEESENDDNSKLLGDLEEDLNCMALDPDPNGNDPDPSGAVAMLEEQASADVEEDDPLQEVILETPEHDFNNMHRIPQLFKSAENNLKRVAGHFKSFYLAVDEEPNEAYQQNVGENFLSEHEKKLLSEYKQVRSEDASGDKDGYEKVAPRHGDVAFHKFLSVIQKNPGQVLR